MSWPSQLRTNAWTGKAAAASGVAASRDTWARSGRYAEVKQKLWPLPPKEEDWRHPEIGWGLILPDNPELPPADRATAVDAPPPIQRLLKERAGSPVFRYRNHPDYGSTYLCRYQRKPLKVKTTQLPLGVAPNALPYYLLIYGSPAEVPWELQYTLNSGRCVGRLDLVGPELERYVEALISGWSDAAPRLDSAVVWATDYGAKDITRLLRVAIAEKVYNALRSDVDIGSKAIYVDGSKTAASRAALAEELATRRPAFILTTSHGMAGPLNDSTQLLENLGLLMDSDHDPVSPKTLLDGWQPDGAIWYAHACYSAGCDAETAFDGLVEPNSDVDEMIHKVAKLGAHVSPLPRKLLGAARPLRAFIGHVEPTFDWTIEDPQTKQWLTGSIKQALYDDLYQRKPVGLALRRVYAHLGELAADYELARKTANVHKSPFDHVAWCLLALRDRQSMVLLGDPTACLPEPPGHA